MGREYWKRGSSSSWHPLSKSSPTLSLFFRFDNWFRSVGFSVGCGSMGGSYAISVLFPVAFHPFWGIGFHFLFPHPCCLSVAFV